jgi:hypothetical protein
MEVKLNTELVSATRATGPAPKPQPASAPGQQVSFDQSAALNDALTRTPAVRTDVVERAKALVSSEHYPPSEMVQKIARLLALASRGN